MKILRRLFGKNRVIKYPKEFMNFKGLIDNKIIIAEKSSIVNEKLMHQCTIYDSETRTILNTLDGRGKLFIEENLLVLY